VVAAAEPEKTVEPEKPATEEPKEDKKIKSPIDLHIVGKIDLDTVHKDSKTKKAEIPKEKKKDKPKEKEIEPPVADAEEEVKAPVEVVENKVEKTPRQPVEEIEDAIPEETITNDIVDLEEDIIKLYRTDFKKLSGPTVVGKIDLPTEEKRKTTPYQQPVKVNGGSDFRRKKRRKRISKEKEVTAVVKPVLPADKKEKPGVKKVVKKRPLRTEVNEEEVQKQIKETLARLTTKGKSKGSRYRREKRDAVSQKHQEVADRAEQDKNILKVTEFVSVNEPTSAAANASQSSSPAPCPRA
jgi:translation initiation factor IF-2